MRILRSVKIVKSRKIQISYFSHIFFYHRSSRLITKRKNANLLQVAAPVHSNDVQKKIKIINIYMFK